MFDGTAPIPLDYRLLDDAYYDLVCTLCLALPPPAGDSEPGGPQMPRMLRGADPARHCARSISPGNLLS